MDENRTLKIVGYAFKICCFYLLNCFLGVPIRVGSYINLISPCNFNKKLDDTIKQLKTLFPAEKIVYKTLCNGTENVDIETEPLACDYADRVIGGENNAPGLDGVCGANNLSEKEANVIDKLKKQITKQIVDEHGENVHIEFQYEDTTGADKQEMIYSMKIKKVGKGEPSPKKFKLSEIYVNTKSKRFYVRTEDGFDTFPLLKRSIVKCERNY